MGTLLYHSALHAERLRQEMFEKGSYPTGAPTPAVRGTLNGRAFTSLTDADPRIGARLEIFAAGQYTWLPFAQIAAVRVEPPKRLRDLLWVPARVRTADAYKGVELGEVLIPALAPLTWRHPDPQVRLGRLTEFEALDDGAEAPVGQKLLLVDGEELPVLELRELVLEPAADGAS
jgi:type VI secretion system protein ImpE